jgi:hypothetical protein
LRPAFEQVAAVRPWPGEPLVGTEAERHAREVEPAIDHEGVLFIMGLVGDIRNAVYEIRDLLRGDDGEEEEEDEDA